MLLATGIAQVSLEVRLESNVFVPTDGTTLAVARSAGQSTRALIAAAAGEQKALMVSGLTTVPAGSRLDYTIVVAEWHLVPSRERKRARFHDAIAAVHGDGHACRGLRGE